MADRLDSIVCEGAGAGSKGPWHEWRLRLADNGDFILYTPRGTSFAFGKVRRTSNTIALVPDRTRRYNIAKSHRAVYKIVTTGRSAALQSVDTEVKFAQIPAAAGLTEYVYRYKEKGLDYVNTKQLSQDYSNLPLTDSAYAICKGLQAQGDLPGYSKEFFDGHRPLTRFEFAVVVDREMSCRQYPPPARPSPKTMTILMKLRDEFAREIATLHPEKRTAHK